MRAAIKDVLLKLHPAVLNRTVSKLIEIHTGAVPESIHIKSVSDIFNGGKTQINTGMIVACENGLLHFGEITLTDEWSRDFTLNREIITPSKTVKFQIIHKNEEVKKQFVHKNVLDYDSIIGNLVLRSRKSGDEIRIAGRNCTKTVNKLFTEAKIKDKNSVILLCDSIGPVWIEGFGCAQRCRITNKTENILKINY